MKLKKTALTLALSMGLIASASATNIDFGEVTPDEIFNGAVGTTGSFVDNLIFKIGGSNLIASGTVTNATLTSVFGIDNFNARLFSGTVGSGTPIGGYLNPTNPFIPMRTLFGEGTFFANQPYYFEISGVSTGSRGGRYSYDVLTAVPEPESYALFLAGLGIMGAIARRRSKANAV